MTDTRPSERRAPVRRVASNPWLWSLLCLAAATLVVLLAEDLMVVAFLFMLVGGWLLGVAFANATLRMPAPTGVIVHVIVAVGSGAALAMVVTADAALPDRMPEALRALAVVARIAAVPAVGWVWLALLSRVTSMIGSRDAAKASARIAPTWEREGDRSVLRFAAIPLEMRSLAWAIAGIVAVLGAIAVAALIATGDLAEQLGARLVIVAVGVLLALPGYLLLVRVLRRRTVYAELELSPDRVRVDAGDAHLDVAFEQIDQLLWRTDSEYARVEIRAGTATVTLNAGLARVPREVAPQLPEPPRHVLRRLELAGLTPSRSSRGVLVYRR